MPGERVARSCSRTNCRPDGEKRRRHLHTNLVFRQDTSFVYKSQVRESQKKSKKQPSPKEHRPVGRPRLTNDLLDVNLQVRVTKKLADTCKSLGGANL